MSSEQEGGVPTKDSNQKPKSTPTQKMSSQDEVDKAILRTQEKKFTYEALDGTSSRTDTDSGYKDTAVSAAEPTDPAESSDSEDMHLQWEDDDEDISAAGGTAQGADEVLDENLLLESSDEMDNTNDAAIKVDNNKLAPDVEDADSTSVDIDKLLKSDDGDQDMKSDDHDLQKPESNPTITEKPDLASNDGETSVTNIMDGQTDIIRVKGTEEIVQHDTSPKFIDKSKMNEKNITTSSPNESLSDTIGVNVDHNLANPDAMIEIPTQEVIEFLDDSDVSLSCTNNTDMETTIEVEKPVQAQKNVETIDVIDKSIAKIDDGTVVLNSGVFEVDVKEQTVKKADFDSNANTTPVSEDDWSEIERRLLKFETSLTDKPGNSDSEQEQIKPYVEIKPKEVKLSKNDIQKANNTLQAVLEDTEPTASTSRITKPVDSKLIDTSNISGTVPNLDIKDSDVKVTAEVAVTDEKDSSEPEFNIVQKVSMSQLTKDMDKSQAKSETVIPSQSVQKLDVAGVESEANALLEASQIQMSLGRVETKVSVGDTVIQKDVVVIPPILVKKLQATKEVAKPSKAETEVPNPDNELNPDIKMDVDSSIQDVDIQPLDIPLESNADMKTTEIETNMEVDDTSDALAKSVEVPLKKAQITEKISLLETPLQELGISSTDSSTQMDIDVPSAIEEIEKPTIKSTSKPGVEPSKDNTKFEETQPLTNLEAEPVSKDEQSTKSLTKSDNVQEKSTFAQNKVQSPIEKLETASKSDNDVQTTKKETDNLKSTDTTFKLDSLQTSTESSKLDTQELTFKDENMPSKVLSKDSDVKLTEQTTDKASTTSIHDIEDKQNSKLFIENENVKKIEEKLETVVENAEIEIKKPELDTQYILSQTETVQETKKLTTTESDKPSTSKDEFKPSVIDDVQPSTSTVIDDEKPTSADDEKPSKSADEAKLTSSVIDDEKPSTSAQSQLAPDISDETEDASDSLGLLAESSRVMEDDEEQEDDDDDDDDFYHEDESSNQMTAEHSEDSNQQQSETEPSKEKETDTESPQEEKGQEEFSFDVGAKEKVSEDKDGDIMEVDETACDDAAESSNKLVLKADTTKDIVIDTQESMVVEEDKPQKPKDIETVKLSDTSDTETEGEPRPPHSILKDALTKEPKSPEDAVKTSPSKSKNTEAQNVVCLEESSSEDDIQEVKKGTPKVASPEKSTSVEGEVTLPGDGEAKTAPDAEEKPEHEVTTATEPTAAESGSTEAQTDSKIDEDPGKSKPKFGLEVFNLDSDEEETAKQQSKAPPTVEPDKPRPHNKCINVHCPSLGLPLAPADAAAAAYYDAPGRRRAAVCAPCAGAVAARTGNLVAGIRDLTPLLDLDIGKEPSELVEISDSDSEGEAENDDVNKETIGAGGAAFIEAELAKTINETWIKFKMDSRLNEAQDELEKEMKKLEEETKEIDAMLNECQVATDQLRNELYATFEQDRHELNSLVIFDTPLNKYICLESSLVVTAEPNAPTPVETRAKRRMSAAGESASKRVAIPLGYTPLDSEKPSATQETKQADQTESKLDDDKDISVMKVSVEAAPSDLPPPGELARPPLRQDMCVYAMRNTFGSWARARVLEVQGKGQVAGASQPFTICRVKLFSKNQNKTKLLPARCLAYPEPSEVRMTIGTRVIALFKDPMNVMKRDTYYSGIVAEVPNPVNNYRYLVFFDDGYAQYVRHRDTRLVCECAPLVWEEVHPFSRAFVREYLVAYPERPMVRLHAGQSLKTEWNVWEEVHPFSRAFVREYLVAYPERPMVRLHAGQSLKTEWNGNFLYHYGSNLVWEEVHPFSRAFVREYLVAYPERPMVRLHAGQSLKTEWNGKWWPSRVVQVDASLVQVHFEEDDRTEWIYRGSTRLAPLYLELQAAERHRGRPVPRTKAQPRVNMPYVEYTRSDEQKSDQPLPPPAITAHEREVRQRAVAKKSTAAPPVTPAPTDSVTSRVVYYTPKNAVKPHKMVTHTCGPKCKRDDTYSLKDLRTYNPLAKPLLSGWERQIVRYNGHKEVMYRAPCGRRLRNIWELHRYLRTVQSDMAVDLFDFTPTTHCLAEFVLNKCLVGKKDLSHGKENVPVPCVNYYDDSLPEFCSYNTERTPTAGVPLNLDPEFLCGCDCTDDCEDKRKCACWKMTLEGARTIGLRGNNIGYVYKRLPEPLPSGIYECNSRCKCKQTCLNRVAQHPLQLKLQVFKTLNRGWGIRALNDVPKGSFLCVYAGNLLTDATANMDGLNEGDEYLAELDYIEVVEQMKEGYEEDIPAADKRLDKKNIGKPQEESEPSSSEEEEAPSKNEEQDGDFVPGYVEMGVTEFSKRLRKRDKSKRDSKKEDTGAKEKESEKGGDDCITISDDEEVREPSSFMAQAGMESNEFVSKYKSVRSYFGKDEACYIMDAKVQGNIGRYLNHSCMPNVFVQNVFVDTHDPRFPWVAFFALSHIKAGTELTWNYNYDVGSVPGKALYCYCGAPNCRGRLL